MSFRIIGDACTVDGCSRPARELGGHCTPCWMSLTPRERALLTWEDPAPDPASFLRGPFLLAALEALWALPAAEPKRRAA